MSLRNPFAWLFRRAAPPPPRPLPEGQQRLHLFAGNFGSEEAARDYLFGPVDAAFVDAPAPMTVDLPEAFINAEALRMGRDGGIAALLGEYFHGEALMDAVQIAAPFDTLALLPEAGLGGVAYRLQDTPSLRYLGAFEVAAPPGSAG